MDKTQRKFLISYNVMNHQGAGFGNTFGYADSLTQEVIERWQATLSEQNGWASYVILNVVELED